jgi:nucleoside-diphosphate-sugar epimerase
VPIAICIITPAMAAPPRKVVIFGGNGYVGSTIARIAVQSGLHVVGGSKSGGKPQLSRYATPEEGKWIDEVEWNRIDATERYNVAEFLDYHDDADAVISTIGLLTRDKKKARRINGDTNVNIAAAVYERDRIRRMVFISGALMWPATRLLPGYYWGKEQAERAIAENLGPRGVALRPGMISGTRVATRYRLPVPLWIAGTPMETIFAPVYRATGLSILTPPSTVEDVAKAALYAALQQPLEGLEGSIIAMHDDICDMSRAWKSETLTLPETPAVKDIPLKDIPPKDGARSNGP